MHRGVGRTRQRALFIGRSAERDRLATLGAGPSEPHVVLVRGEAGVGKTSLLRVASWDLEEQGHTVLWLLGGHVPPITWRARCGSPAAT
ncbi:MAG: ATP-binding protein [Myxococcales bacterium]|nr:ATP-binding protein [Myxococcales bacterium]